MLQRHFQSSLGGLLMCSVFLSFLFTSSIFAQQGKMIESVDILGNRRLKDEEILQHIKTRSGERFEDKQVQNDLQSLLKLGLFDTSETRVTNEIGARGGVHVMFLVMELPLIVQIKFEGLCFITKEEILAELREQKAEVAANSPYQPANLRKARTVITEYLAMKRGFPDAKVNTSVEEVSATTLKISFIINELPNNEKDCCDG